MLYAKPKNYIMKKLTLILLSLSFLFSCTKPEPRPLSTTEKATIKVAMFSGMYLAERVSKKEKQDTVEYPSGPSFKYEE